MRNHAVRALVFVCLLSIAAPVFAAPRGDESGLGRLFSRIVRVVRHLLPLDTVDPTYPKP
jgi:hypothetical protein